MNGNYAPPPPAQIYPEEAHGLYGVTRHLYQTMEAFLDEIFGPIEDYFVNDYYLAAAKLLEVNIYGRCEQFFCGNFSILFNLHSIIYCYQQL